MPPPYEYELAKAINQLCDLLREWRAENDAALLEQELARSARHSRRLEKIAAALSRLDALTPAKAGN